MRFAVAALILLATCPALADECTMGWVVSLDQPRNATTVRPGTHFRVLEYWGCSPVSGGPRHEYRLQTGTGAPIAFTTIPWAEHYLELVPDVPVQSGEIELEVRRPTGSGVLGPFEKLARVTVSGTADTAAPVFDGLAEGRASAVEGTVRLSPCQGVPGWQLETRLTFAAARDAESAHDELVYLLERARRGEARWERVTTLRPTPSGNRMTFSWKDERGWGDSWVYRMGVRDMAGNETTGARTVSVQNPQRPGRELWKPAGASTQIEPTRQSRCLCDVAVGSHQGPGHFAPVFSLLFGTAAFGVLQSRRRSR